MEMVYNLSQALDFFYQNPLEECEAPDGTVLFSEEDAERYFANDGSIDNSDIEETDDLLGNMITGIGILGLLDDNSSSNSNDSTDSNSGIDFGGGGEGFDGGGASGDY